MSWASSCHATLYQRVPIHINNPSPSQLAAMMAEVQAQVAPLEAACEAELQRLQGLEERRRELTGVLAELQTQAANVE